MGGFERGGVVGAVACDCDHLIVGLQSFDKTLLVHRASPGYDFEVAHTAAQLGVGQCGKLAARDNATVCVGIAPQAYAAPYLAGGGRSIACDYFHVYARMAHKAHGVGHIRTHRVGYGHYAEQPHMRPERGKAVEPRDMAVGQLHAGKTECAHALTLIAEQA